MSTTRIDLEASLLRRLYWDDGLSLRGIGRRLMEKYDNLYADLSGMSGYNAMTRDPDFTPGFIERRWRRLFFGTDVCYANDRLPIIEWMRTTPMDESAREAIAETNARDLLGLDAP